MTSSKPDPKYPFPNRLNEKDEIVYSVPIEANSPAAVATLDTEHNGGVHYLRLRSGRRIAVVYIETTNKALAYQYRAWLNTGETRERRRRLREEFLEGNSEDMLRDEHPLLRTIDEGFIRVDHEDLPNLIARFIDEQHPTNPLYRKVYLLCVQEYKPETIAQILKIDKAMVYFFRKKAYQAAEEYRRRYIK